MVDSEMIRMKKHSKIMYKKVQTQAKQSNILQSSLQKVQKNIKRLNIVPIYKIIEYKLNDHY